MRDEFRAIWADEEDRHGQVLISAADIAQAGKVSELRSLCDDLRNRFLPPLAEWLGAQELPGEWKGRAAHLVQWRSGDRLAALIRWWGDHRLPDDEEAWQEANWWRTRYLHLSNWWRGQQDQICRRIREQYRVFAAGVARKYGTVVIEEFDLREVLEIPEPEDEGGNPRNHYRQTVSPSAFRLALTQTCSREGVTVIKRPAAYTTRACSACGNDDKWDSACNVMHRCERCGTLFDQDHNAAVNLLRGWQAEHLQKELPVLA